MQTSFLNGCSNCELVPHLVTERQANRRKKQPARQHQATGVGWRIPRLIERNRFRALLLALVAGVNTPLIGVYGPAKVHAANPVQDAFAVYLFVLWFGHGPSHMLGRPYIKGQVWQAQECVAERGKYARPSFAPRLRASLKLRWQPPNFRRHPPTWALVRTPTQPKLQCAPLALMN